MHKIAIDKDMPNTMDLKCFQIDGLYSFKEKKVYILDSLDMKPGKGQAILLHEPVHSMQYQQGHHRSVSCKNQLESLAYSLKARYLSVLDYEAGFTAGHINRESRCT